MFGQPGHFPSVTLTGHPCCTTCGGWGGKKHRKECHACGKACLESPGPMAAYFVQNGILYEANTTECVPIGTTR